MSPIERQLLLDAFDSNWVAPLGPHVDALEREFSAAVGVEHAVALASGTAALHLAMILADVKAGDEVATSTLTFIATANAVQYTGAKPVFIDSQESDWNLDPELLAAELSAASKRGRRIKAVLAVDVMGQCADYLAIQDICRRYDAVLIEDAAEGLGASYRGAAAGTFGELGCFSFNGNKIITTSGGGMLVTNRQDLAARARFLATQARDPLPHHQHSAVGYNYRLSNLLAAVGRGQLQMLPQRVASRRANFDYYRDQLRDLPGLNFMPEPLECHSTRWLTCLTIDPRLANLTREDVRLALEAENIESRPVFLPMHCQPIYRDCRVRGGQVSERLFEQGLSLPSGSSLTTDDLSRVVNIVRGVFGKNTRAFAAKFELPLVAESVRVS